jgi:hypothetical protein
MKTSTTLCSMLVLALAGNALADDVCKQGSATRTVSIVYDEPGKAVPCEVLYEKSDAGTKQTLWRAANEAGYCEARAKEFVEKLASMGWACSTDKTQPDD